MGDHSSAYHAIKQHLSFVCCYLPVSGVKNVMNRLSVSYPIPVSINLNYILKFSLLIMLPNNDDCLFQMSVKCLCLLPFSQHFEYTFSLSTEFSTFFCEATNPMRQGILLLLLLH